MKQDMIAWRYMQTMNTKRLIKIHLLAKESITLPGTSIFNLLKITWGQGVLRITSKEMKDRGFQL